MSEPGWYHDPTDPSRLRLWNGSSWTDDVRPAPAPPTPTIPPTPSTLPPPTSAARTPALAFSPSGSPDRRRSHRRWWVVAGISTSIAVVAASAAVALTTTEPPSPDVGLIGAAELGTDPFIPPATGPIPTEPPAPGGISADLPPAGPGPTITAIPAATPGLYAVSGATRLCETITDSVLADSSDAQAFAAAIGVAPSELPRFLTQLTPVVLRLDTRVSSTGSTAASPATTQAVLEAGTAVLIDPQGVPRVRCRGANPLGPATLTESQPRYVGTAWPGFEASRLASITPAPSTLSSIEVLDGDTRQLQQLPIGAGGLVLEPDGLGVASIGDPTDEVLGTLTALLGNPTHVDDGFIDGGLFLFVSWESLTTVFQLPRGVAGEESSPFGFNGYLFGPWLVDEDGDPMWWVRQRGDDGSWSPRTWERSLATPEGIGIGSAAALADAAFPETTVIRNYVPGELEQGKSSICAVRIPHSGIEPLAGLPAFDQRIAVGSTLDDLFLAPAQDGRVWGIGAGVLCFT